MNHVLELLHIFFVPAPLPEGLPQVFLWGWLVAWFGIGAANKRAYRKYRRDTGTVVRLRRIALEAEATIAFQHGAERDAAVRARAAALSEIAAIEPQLREFEISVSAHQ